MLRFFSVVGIKLDFSGFEFGLTPSFLPASLRYAETGKLGLDWQLPASVASLA